MVVIYLTGDKYNAGNSGGSVVRHEVAALSKVFPEVLVLDRDELTSPVYRNLDVPQLQDYFALSAIQEIPNIELIHAYSSTFSECFKWAKSKGIPTTYMTPAHDLELSIAEYEKQIGPYPYMHLKDSKLWSQFSSGLRYATKVIVPSRHSRDFVLKQNVKPTSIEIIPHGCDIPEIVPPLPEKFNVGYLGAIGSDKGLPYLIEAWGILNRDYPDMFKDSTLMLAGRGTEALETLVRRLADKGNFALLGWQDSVSTFFANISLYVHPSVTESFGMEIVEAMAHGRGIIATDNTAGPDLILDNIAGYIVDACDPQDLAMAIKNVRERDLAARMGAKARELSVNYSWNKVEERYIKLWKSLI